MLALSAIAMANTGQAVTAVTVTHLLCHHALPCWHASRVVKPVNHDVRPMCEVVSEDVLRGLVRCWPNHTHIGEPWPAAQVGNESRRPVLANRHLRIIIGAQDVVGTLSESCHCRIILRPGRFTSVGASHLQHTGQQERMQRDFRAPAATTQRPCSVLSPCSSRCGCESS